MLNKIMACFVICTFNIFNSGCTAGRVESPNPAPTNTAFIVPGKPPEDQSESFCKVACQHLRELFCEQGYPVASKPDITCTKDDIRVDCVSCEQFCEDTVEDGVWLDGNCISQLLPAEVTPPACPEIETCAERANRTIQ